MKADSPEFQDLLTRWHAAKQQAILADATEKALREEIFKQAFPAPKKGTNKIRLPFGMALVGDYRLNYRIDQAALQATDLKPELKERVISYRPEVKAGEFNKLTPEEHREFGDIITETPGTPGLQIKEAKNLRWGKE